MLLIIAAGSIFDQQCYAARKGCSGSVLVGCGISQALTHHFIHIKELNNRSLFQPLHIMCVWGGGGTVGVIGLWSLGLYIYIYIFIRTYFLQSSTQKMQLYTNRIYKKIIILLKYMNKINSNMSENESVHKTKNKCLFY